MIPTNFSKVGRFPSYMGLVGMDGCVELRNYCLCFCVCIGVIGKKINIKRSLIVLLVALLFEPRSEKTGLRGFRPGLTQTGLCSHRRWLEA